MKDFIVKYWLECAFTAVTGVFAWAYRKLKKRVDEQELIKQGVLAILHDRLFQAGRHYITQVFKGVGVLSKLPTDILVLVLSIGITVTAFMAYMQYIQQVIIWYMIIAAILAGFIVAFVAMYGWEKLSELWKRFYKGK